MKLKQKGDFGMFRKKEDFFDSEVKRIQQKMMTLEVDSEEYRAAQQTLKATIGIRGEQKETKRRISKEHKGQFLIKLLGVGGILGGIFMTSKFERDGNTYTGEKRKWMDSLCSNIGRFNLFG